MGTKRFDAEFKTVLSTLDELGYINYFSILNAKDYGVPQNRERIFIISIRKDIDVGEFSFPNPYDLKLRWMDMLEEDVDEKYYLSDTFVYEVINSHDWELFPKINTVGIRQIGNLMPSKNRSNPNQGRLYDKAGLCPTLSTMSGGNRQPFIMVKARGGAI